MSDLKDNVATLARVAEQVKELQARRERMTSEDRTQLDKLTADLAQASNAVATQNRRAEFAVDDVRGADMDTYRSSVTLEELHQRVVPLHPVSKQPLTMEGAEIIACQQAMDDLYILGTLLKKDPRHTAYFKRACRQLPMLQKAVGSTAGADWIPTGFSSDLHQKVRLALRVAALHPRIDMPTNPYKLPIEGTDAVAYLVAEQPNPDADIASESTVGDRRVISSFGDSPQLAPNDPGMINLTLTAKKLGARTTFSTEITEESIIPILPYMRDKLVAAMRDAQEDTTINGDTNVGTGSAIDSDMTSASLKNHRAAWNGYRKIAISTAKIAAASATALDVTDLRTLRMRMGKYAVNPADCVIVTGPVGYAKLLTLRDGSNPSPVMTIEKYGPAATLVTGEIARVDGMPIVLSEFVREDLNQVGLYGATTVNRTQIFMVNRRQFVYGDFRQTTLKSREIIETDQTVLVTLQRLCFMPWFASAPIVGHIYNIQNSFA